MPEILLKFKGEQGLSLAQDNRKDRGKLAYMMLHTAALLLLFDKKLSFICSEFLVRDNFESLFHEVALTFFLSHLPNHHDFLHFSSKVESKLQV